MLAFFGLNRHIRVMFIAMIRDHEPFKKSTPMHNCCRKSAEENSERLCCHSGHYAAGRPQLFASPTFSVSPSQRDLTRTWLSRPRVPMGWTNICSFSCVPFASLCFSSPIRRFFSRVIVMLIFLGFRPQVFHL